jgi:hypothetical protein
MLQISGAWSSSLALRYSDDCFDDNQPSFAVQYVCCVVNSQLQSSHIVIKQDEDNDELSDKGRGSSKRNAMRSVKPSKQLSRQCL